MQYTALSFGKRLEEVGICASMGRAGSDLDNAMAESFVSTVKCEVLHRHRLPTRETAKTAIFEYMEGFCNRTRRHSALGYKSPVDYEKATMEEAAVAFAYPYGQQCHYSAETVGIVREAGFSCACSSIAGVVERFTEQFQLPRSRVPDCNGERFAKRLSRWFYDYMMFIRSTGQSLDRQRR